MNIHLSSLMMSLLLTTGCGHVARQIDEFQRIGAEQVAVGRPDDSGGEPLVAVPAEAETNYVADMECPPIETAGANLRLSSSCSQVRVGSVAVASRDESSGRPSGVANGPRIPAAATAAARVSDDELRSPDSIESPMAQLPREPGAPKRGRKGYAPDDDAPKAHVPTLMPLPSQSPTMAGTMIDNEDMCEGQWIRWGPRDELYDCCLPAADWPQELSQMCTSTTVSASDE